MAPFGQDDDLTAHFRDHLINNVNLPDSKYGIKQVAAPQADGDSFKYDYANGAPGAKVFKGRNSGRKVGG